MPSRSEVRAALATKYSYWRVNRLEVIGEDAGRVRWDPQDRYWVYQPHTAVTADAANLKFPEAESMALNALRFRFRDDQWEPDPLFSTALLYRGLPDPSPDQVIALLEQPGIEFGLLDFAQVPRKMSLRSLPRFTPVLDGFGPPRLPVEVFAEVELLDFPNEQIHTAAVTFRTYLFCQVRDERWSAGPKVELLDKKILHSRSAHREELWEKHWAMDRWWRNPR
ncbi:hypothetical protein [Pseudomarimonas arenosa]|uniref:Uncharacterized protein n=1 Tax=Pseudomarimonas arenosa TaxID=2774145 RepID=A0AAW3ZIU9_9GAMM|nr:hypothetical protein [Pseudomarimonas arenosa]MBD8525072.1 hypothetical protein [Pseudomarimonas arenosa]